MKILANRNIKLLFNLILFSMLAVTLFSLACMGFGLENAAVCIWLASLCMGAGIMAFCYGYFKEQNRIMEAAVEQIREYISGNKDARIESNAEGELYSLFHEVNALVAILNAHAENERRAKVFLKDTISDISHQLKTPLAALSIYNGIMQQEAEGIPAMKEFLASSEQELDRIGNLVQNLLNVAKFDVGAMMLKKASENLSEMMESVKKRFQFRAASEQKEILLDGDETLVLWCDRGWLTESVGNLVKNALDHTDPGGVIRIEWKQAASVIQINVKDNGSGIHPEDLYYIFKRFYRSRYSKDTQGIGLGLSLAKAVVEAHEGTIRVDSDPGRGTNFTMEFLIPTKL